VGFGEVGVLGGPDPPVDCSRRLYSAFHTEMAFGPINNIIVLT